MYQCITAMELVLTHQHYSTTDEFKNVLKGGSIHAIKEIPELVFYRQMIVHIDLGENFPLHKRKMLYLRELYNYEAFHVIPC